jgi:hypothetical protein
MKGKFTPKNPKKYKGNPTNIIIRSGWECEMMLELDRNDNILEWSSEEVIIPYICATDNKPHRYFPDFWVKKRRKDGKIEEQLIEIKPLNETVPPRKYKNKERYIREMMTFVKNQSKWRAAKEYCRKKNWEFIVISKKKEKFVLLTEKDLNL